MADRGDLRYTADRCRDFGRSPDSTRNTMLEEIAVALHRVAEAIEDQDDQDDQDD